MKPIQPNDTITNYPPHKSQRIDYVDLVKGITILWIIWQHTDCPDFGNFRMPVFFFASGIFFKISNLSVFIQKRWKAIIIPFFFFYIISIPLSFLKDWWDFHSIHAFDWNRVYDIFKVTNDRAFLSLNWTLWFLLALFFIQILALFIFRFNRKIIAVSCLLSLLFHHQLEFLSAPLAINLALAYYGYFGLGYLMGKPLINFMNTRRRKIIVGIISGCLLFATIWYLDYGFDDLHGMVEKIKQIAFVVVFTAFFSFFDGVKFLECLRFFGKNSLIVLGTHIWVLFPIQRISWKLLGFAHPAIGFCMAVLAAAITVPLILMMNKYIPFLVGKTVKNQNKTLPTLNPNIQSLS